MAAQDYEQVTYNSPSGAMIGSSATEKIAFHGSTPVVQANAITTFVSGTAATTATYGIPTPDIAALGTAINAVIVALRNKGIIAT